jgi:hypothetical protein
MARFDESKVVCKVVNFLQILIVNPGSRFVILLVRVDTINYGMIWWASARDIERLNQLTQKLTYNAAMTSASFSKLAVECLAIGASELEPPRTRRRLLAGCPRLTPAIELPILNTR